MMFQQRYVIHFYLSFNRSLYSDPLGYCNEIREHWMRATGYLGTCVYPEMHHQLSDADAQKALRIDRIMQEEAGCPLGALNSMPENQTGQFGLPSRICIYPKGFKWFHEAPVLALKIHILHSSTCLTLYTLQIILSLLTYIVSGF